MATEEEIQAATLTHARNNSIGVIGGLVISLLGIAVTGGILYAQIQGNTSSIERISEENKEGFDEIRQEIAKLRDSETNKELGILKVRLDGLEKDKERLEAMITTHDHNGQYVSKADYERDIEKIEEDVKEKQ